MTLPDLSNPSHSVFSEFLADHAEGVEEFLLVLIERM